MNKIAIFGFTPREEVIVSILKRQNPNINISLFTDSINIPLQKRVDNVYSIANDTPEIIKNGNFDIVLIGPEKYSASGIIERLSSVGVNAIGCDKEQIKIETDKCFLRENFKSLVEYYAPFEIIYHYDEQQILKVLARYKLFVVKYIGVYNIIGGGTKIYGIHLKTIGEALEFISYCINNCGKVVIEKYIEGIDFSVNALTSKKGDIFFFSENHCYKLRDKGDQGTFDFTWNIGVIEYSWKLRNFYCKA